MIFKIILICVAALAVIFIILSFIAGNIMFSMVLIPKSDKNMMKKKKIDMSEDVIKFFNDMTSWVNEHCTRKIEITTFDGLKLKAKLIEQKDSDKWAIVVHGYTSVGDHMQPFAQKYSEAGYNVLIPDLRGHGESEGRYATMGYYDSVDIIEWVYEILKMNENAKIVLHGLSMGAATVMVATGEDLTGHVRCAVEDCGYTSVFEEFRSQSSTIAKLPSLPILTAANILANIRIKMDFRKNSALDSVKKSKTPTLFIHGDQDAFVPYRMLDELYSSASCEKDILIVPGAAHGESAAREPQMYWNKVWGFVNKYIG
ncbi:MAG: alpha/beta hydrolase [Clostridia bacterium]